MKGWASWSQVQWLVSKTKAGLSRQTQEPSLDPASIQSLKCWQQYTKATISNSLKLLLCCFVFVFSLLPVVVSRNSLYVAQAGLRQTSGPPLLDFWKLGSRLCVTMPGFFLLFLEYAWDYSLNKMWSGSSTSYIGIWQQKTQRRLTLLGTSVW